MGKRNISGISDSNYAHLNGVQMLNAKDPIHDSSSTSAPLASSDNSTLSEPYRRRLRSYPDLRPAKFPKYTIDDDPSSDYTPFGTIERYTIDDDSSSDYIPPGTIESMADDSPSSDYTPSTTSAGSSPEPSPRRRDRRRRDIRPSASKPATGPAPQPRSRNDDRTGNQGSDKALPQDNPDVGPSNESPSPTALVAELRALYTRFDLVHEDVVGFDWCAYRGWLLNMLPFAQEQMQLNYQLEASKGEIGGEEFYGKHNHMHPFLLAM